MIVQLPRPCLGTDILEAFRDMNGYEVSWHSKFRVVVREQFIESRDTCDGICCVVFAPTYSEGTTKEFLAQVFLDTNIHFFIGQYSSSVELFEVGIDPSGTYFQICLGMYLTKEYIREIEKFIEGFLGRLKFSKHGPYR